MIDNNAIASNNLSSNNIASGNLSQNTLISFGGLFKGLENTVGVFVPTLRNALVERYRAETFYRIGLKAEEIIKILGIETKPIPPKAALPMFEKASLEHDENMYDLWAKLLVATSNDYNPISMQYSDILSKIGFEEAQLLKRIYDKQISNGGIIAIHKCKRIIEQRKDRDTYERYIEALTKKNSLQTLRTCVYIKSANFPLEIEGESEEFERTDFEVSLETFEKSKAIINIMNVLVQLNLVHIEFQCIKKGVNSWAPYWGLVLTEYGYNFVETLESYNIEDK